MITEWGGQIKPQHIQKSIFQRNNFIRTTLVALLTLVTIVAVGQTALPTTPNSILLDGNVYTVSTNTDITASKAGEAGLRVRQNARVVINIKAGATLTVTGANADADAGFAGMPGILVPESSTLVIIGEGTLTATGGNGTSGKDGDPGQNARGDVSPSANPFTYTYDANKNFGGAGGKGGDGGNGAGAGIGGAGGKGGAGGAATAQGANATSYSGAAGNAGSKGSMSGGMGKVYILGKVTVNANAGTGGLTAGAAKANGISGYTTSKSSNYYYSIGGGGAGGGGAAGGAPTCAIGAGGIAGGGGGSGGQGGADSNNNYAANAGKASPSWGFGTQADAMTVNQAICTAAPGEGGLGAKAGSKTTGVTRDEGPGRTATFKVFGFTVSSNIQHYPNTGGVGGAAGDEGDEGVVDNVYRMNTSTINANTKTAAKNLQPAYTSESQIPAEIRALYEVALTFDNQGGSTARAAEKLVKGEPIENLAGFTIPTKAGYYFEGYFTETEGGEKIYDHSGNAVDATRSFTTNQTLYAHWIDTKFTIVWDYSYIDKDGTRKVVKDEDKSHSANVKFNVADAIEVPAGSITTGTGNYAGHTIATAIINAVVGSGVNNATTVYVTEEQLKTLSVTASAILAEDNKYITTNVSSHEALMSAVPDGSYNQPWSITITNGVKPDEVNVQLLSSTSPSGPYSLISQMEHLSVACENNEGVYSGTYPVWPDNISKLKLYYKAQVVSYEIAGVTHNVSGMPLTDVTSSYDALTTLTQSVALPMVHLNLNNPRGTAPHYTSGTTEYKYATTYGEEISLGSYAAELQNYTFKGWTSTQNGDDYVSVVTANGDVTVYASWADAIPPVINFTGSKLNETTDLQGYVHGSMDVYVHIEDANDGTETTQWYYIADNKNETPTEGQWMPLTNGQNGTYTVTIEGTNFAFGYVYIKTKDNDDNYSYVISDQYKVDNQAPFIFHNPEGRREETFSVVCSDNDYPTIDVTVEDNVGVNAITINGNVVTNDTNLPIGVTTDVINGIRHFYLAKPGEDDATEYDNDKNPIIPEFKVYTISATDAAGNTATRLMNVYVTHEWNVRKNAKGQYLDKNGNVTENIQEAYIVEPATEPKDGVPGLLPHVNCKHCARYILVNKNGEWTKVDKESPSQLAEVQLLPGCVLVMNETDIFDGCNSINAALTRAKEYFNREGTKENPIGIATIIKLTPNSVGAKVDADLNIATLVNPGRSLTLDLNGQSIDNDGVAYASGITGNSNVTILLTDDGALPYTNKSAVSGSPVSYVRTFSGVQGGKWQALYVPFVIDNADGAELGIIDLARTNGGVTTLHVSSITSGYEANQCYFVKHAAGKMTMTGTTLNGVTLNGKDLGEGYTVEASLKNDDHEATADRAFWVVTNGGSFTWAKVGSHQRPYRWVVKTPNGQQSAKSMVLSFDEYDAPTGIKELKGNGRSADVIYTIDGRRMQNADNLRPGIYVKGGRKMVVR